MSLLGVLSFGHTGYLKKNEPIENRYNSRTIISRNIWFSAIDQKRNQYYVARDQFSLIIIGDPAMNKNVKDESSFCLVILMASV